MAMSGDPWDDVPVVRCGCIRIALCAGLLLGVSPAAAAKPLPPTLLYGGVGWLLPARVLAGGSLSVDDDLLGDRPGDDVMQRAASVLVNASPLVVEGGWASHRPDSAGSAELLHPAGGRGAAASAGWK